MVDKRRMYTFLFIILSICFTFTYLVSGTALSAVEDVYGDTVSSPSPDETSNEPTVPSDAYPVVDTVYPPPDTIIDEVYPISVINVYYTGKIAVTNRYWDNIGAVLKDIGIEYSEVKENTLSRYDKIQEYDVIFVNNSGSSELYSKAAANTIQKYVYEGGNLFVTDYAVSFVNAAFPDYLRFSGHPRIGREGEIVADIIDSQLTAELQILDNKTRLQYILQSWTILEDVNSETNVLISGSYRTFKGKKVKKPLAVTFNYGNGKVTYCTFSLINQNKEFVKALLNRSVFKSN